jgi:hypothetical protein
MPDGSELSCVDLSASVAITRVHVPFCPLTSGIVSAVSCALIRKVTTNIYEEHQNMHDWLGGQVEPEPRGLEL